MEKKIRIAHLYYDLMNLYGENGNVRALKKFIERQGVECEVDELSIEDKIDYSKYDLFYMGAGCEENEFIILSDLYKYRDDIKKAIEDGKTFLVTGNSLELFGIKIKVKNGRDVQCLGIFDFNAVEARSRLVSDLFYECNELEEGKGRNIVAFKNCNCNIVNNSNKKMFRFADNLRYKNFFGMTFIGPICIRNPYFTDYVLTSLFETLDLEYVPKTDTTEYKAYHEFVNNFIINRNFD